MAMKFTAIKPARVPPAADGIQVNYCKNPACLNYGVPALEKLSGQKRVSAGHDSYIASGGGTSMPVLKCKLCNEFPSIKSNVAIAEELNRMLADLRLEPEPSCPDTQCANHSVPVTTGKGHYQSYGKTHSGSKRYLCNVCKRTFTVSFKSTIRQRHEDKNQLIFSLLMNKSPMRRICEVADINPKTLYQRINFFYEQCKTFVADREQQLLEGKVFPRLYIAVDRQDYTVNWSNQDDKRNVVMHAVGSADHGTGYVFGMHLDFDPSLDPAQIEQDAAALNDQSISYPFRRYARLWLKSDYTDYIRQRRRLVKRVGYARDVTNDVADTYGELADRLDIEAPLSQSFDTTLPKKGMQVHSEYTLYGHFFYLKHLFGGVEKMRFFLDQESGIRAACLSAFSEEIKARKADAFYVRINKDLTVNERRQALAISRAEFEKAKNNYPSLKGSEVELLLIQDRLQHMSTIGKWSDRWLLHPFPSMSEPEKAICYMTNYGDYAADHLARLYSKASLHSIDRFFMQLRRRLSLFERPIVTSSAQGRSWFGYSPYNPEVAMKMLMIFRVFYNYVAVGEDKKTPAMRLGLAKGKVGLDDIINFSPKNMA
ncbi:MAG: hypothetical protein PHG47_08155 [Sulfuricella sp.]|nr:hypothetical protein [Sulfuricella sp.]